MIALLLMLAALCAVRGGPMWGYPVLTGTDTSQMIEQPSTAMERGWSQLWL